MNNGIVRFYENHAQDARVKRIVCGVAQTLGSSDANSPGSTGNNPIVMTVRDGRSRRNQDGWTR